MSSNCHQGIRLIFSDVVGSAAWIFCACAVKKVGEKGSQLAEKGRGVTSRPLKKRDIFIVWP